MSKASYLKLVFSRSRKDSWHLVKGHAGIFSVGGLAFWVLVAFLYRLAGKADEMNATIVAIVFGAAATAALFFVVFAYRMFIHTPALILGEKDDEIQVHIKHREEMREYHKQDIAGYADQLEQKRIEILNLRNDNRDWWINNLIDYLVHESAVGENIVSVDEHPGRASFAYFQMATEVRQAAADGRLTVWAKKDGAEEPYVRLSREFWLDYAFEDLAAYMTASSGGLTGPPLVRIVKVVGYPGTDNLVAPMFSSVQVKALWKPSERRHHDENLQNST